MTTLDTFNARMREICADMEADVLTAKARFDICFNALVETAKHFRPEDAPAFAAIARVHLAEVERRLLSVVEPK